MFDTTIWSRLYDRNAAEAFLRLEDSATWRLLVPPSTLLEALRTPNAVARKGIVSLITARRREHPQTEAHVEAMELVEVVRKYRSQWLRRFPRTDRIATLDNFWQKKVWLLAREHTTEASVRLELSEQAVAQERSIDAGVELAKRNRREVLRSGLKLDREGLQSLKVDLTHASEPVKAGWKGDHLEPWRVELADLFWGELVHLPARAWRTREDTTIADFVLPWVQSSKLAQDRSDWNLLFYQEAKAQEMPRNWLRCYVRYAQYGQKVSHGNPVDEQHSSYLPDADVFLTGDSRFANAVNDVASFSPVRIATAVVIPPSTDDVVGCIEAALDDFVSACGTSEGVPQPR